MIWNGIQKNKPLLLANACLQVSTTSHLPIWTTSWIPFIPFFKPSPKFPNNLNQPSLLISDLISSDTLQWIPTVVHSIFDNFGAREILKRRILNDPNPHYIWTPSSSSKFSISSGYLTLIQSNLPVCSPTVSMGFWKSIQKLNLNDRLRNFLWKIAWNILPTMAQLNAIFPSYISTECPLCKSALDSLQHLFFNCTFAQVVWHNSPWPLDSTALNFYNMVDWVKLIIAPTSLGISITDHHKFQIFATVSCDLLWHYRNKPFHDALSFDVVQVSQHIDKISMKHFTLWHQIPTPMERWLPPTSPGFKINFDTTIRNTFSAQAVVCRNHRGHIVSMISQINSPCLPNYGEALAAHLAISLATSLKLEKFTIECDSQVVILFLISKCKSLKWLFYLCKIPRIFLIGASHLSFTISSTSF